MESTESSYVSSPEASPKRSPPLPKSPTADSAEKPTYIRFLISNAAAGSVIGKGGATITDFQSQSGARIQLSRNYEFFPGTSDRIIMVSGTLDDVLKAVDLILTKLLSELHTEDGVDVDPRTKVRLVVPNSSCGSIIGKGGSIINTFWKYNLEIRDEISNKVSHIESKLETKIADMARFLVENQTWIQNMLLGRPTEPPRWAPTEPTPPAEDQVIEEHPDDD